MPPVSQAQRRLMWAASKTPGGVDGVSQSVGKEFAAADPGGKLPARAKRDSGGGLDLSYSPPMTGEWGRKYTAGLSNIGDRLDRQEEANPSVEGSSGKGEGNNLRAVYRKSIGFDSGGSVPGNSTQRDWYRGKQPPTVEDFGLNGERGDIGGSLDQMPIGTRAYDGHYLREASRARGGGVKDGRSLADHAYKLSRRMAREQEKAAEPHFADGGMPQAPFFERSAARELEYENDHPMKGFINSAGPGRTDTHPLSVGSGSYVLSADSISGLGQGNSAFGANVIQKMLSVGPYGTPMPRIGRASPGLPRAPAPYYSQPAYRQQDIESVWPPHFGKGGVARDGDGNDEDQGQPVPVALAGGEFVIPENWWTDGKEIYKGVKQIGGGDIKLGHKILDKFMLSIRDRAIKETKALPGPKKGDEK